VPAFTADKAIRIIEKDLGRTVEQLFATFERRPIAAASLGQVRAAQTRIGQSSVRGFMLNLRLRVRIRMRPQPWQALPWTRAHAWVAPCTEPSTACSIFTCALATALANQGPLAVPVLAGAPRHAIHWGRGGWGGSVGRTPRTGWGALVLLRDLSDSSYRCRARPQVVVKVQRPGLKALFDIDLQNLKLLAEQLDRGDENRDFKGIYKVSLRGQGGCLRSHKPACRDCPFPRCRPALRQHQPRAQHRA
jgi:hypothetical protein